MSTDDEQLRKDLKPAVPLATALEICRRVWGLQPLEGDKGAKQLDSYDDNNFYMVHNGVESADGSVLDFQNKMMGLLQSQGIPCPSVVPLPNGEIFHYEDLPVKGPQGTARLAVRMLNWVEGTPLVAMPCTARALVNAGAFLGRIDQVLDSLEHPAALREHVWDLQRIKSLHKFVSCIPDPARRALVQSVLEAFSDNIFPVAHTFRRGVLMSDFNDANIIVDSDDVERMVGVIDFGDSVESWRVNDVAIAMAYAAVSAFGKPRPVQAAACLLKGFVTVYPLQEQETKHLLTLAAGRLAISVTLGAYSYQKDPSNMYLLIHAEPAWAALHTLWYSDRGAIETLFSQALSGGSIEELLESDFPVLTSAPPKAGSGDS